MRLAYMGEFSLRPCTADSFSTGPGLTSTGKPEFRCILCFAKDAAGFQDLFLLPIEVIVHTGKPLRSTEDNSEWM